MNQEPPLDRYGLPLTLTTKFYVRLKSDLLRDRLTVDTLLTEPGDSDTTMPSANVMEGASLIGAMLAYPYVSLSSPSLFTLHS